MMIRSQLDTSSKTSRNLRVIPDISVLVIISFQGLFFVKLAVADYFCTFVYDVFPSVNSNLQLFI